MRIINSSNREIPLPNGCVVKTGGSARLSKLTPAIVDLIHKGELSPVDFTVDAAPAEPEPIQVENAFQHLTELQRKRVIIKTMIDSGQIASPIRCTTHPQEK